MVSELIPETGKQSALWEKADTLRKTKLVEVMDKLNQKGGRNTVKFAIQGSGKSWKMRQNSLSPNYTTRWNDLLKVDVDHMYRS